MVENRSTRVRLLAVLALAGVFGIGLEVALDPVEGTGGAAFGLITGVTVFGLVAGYWYSRTHEAQSGLDERFAALERRASRVSQGILIAGVALVAIGASLPTLPLPVAPSLWGLLLVSIGAHELAIEHYRRKM